MINNADRVRLLLLSQPENSVIDAADLYQDSGMSVPQSVYYQILDGMTKPGELVRLCDGIYYRPRVSRFGRIPLSEKQIVSYYTAGNKGLLVGYRMYVGLGITTQISRNAEVLSVRVREQQKKVGNVSVSRIDLSLNKSVQSTIEALEILQNFNTIQDLNMGAFNGYFAKFADEYNPDAVDYVLARMEYGKSTIAFMKAFLDILNIPNRLDRYISNVSEYSIPDVKKIYAAS